MTSDASEGIVILIINIQFEQGVLFTFFAAICNVCQTLSKRLSFFSRVGCKFIARHRIRTGLLLGNMYR